MAAEINIPVRIEVLKDSISSLQSILSNLKIDSTSFKTISKYIQDMTKEMTSFQALTSKSFSSQNDFNKANKSIEKMEGTLAKAKLAMTGIKFPEIKLSDGQQAQWDSFNKQIEEAAKKVQQAKDTIKGNLLADTGNQNLFANLDPKYMEKSFDELYSMVDKKSQELSRKMQAAKEKMAQFEGAKTLKGNQIKSLTTNGITQEAIGQDTFNRFFELNKKGNFQFKDAGAGNTPMKAQFLEYLQQTFSLTDADIQGLQNKLGEKGGLARLNSIFKSMGENNMFTRAQERTSSGPADKLRAELEAAKQAYEEYQNIKQKFDDANSAGGGGKGAGEVGQALQNYEQVLQRVNAEAAKFSQNLEKGFSGSAAQPIQQANSALEQYRTTLSNTNAELLKYERANRTFQSMKMTVANFMGFYQVINLVKRGVKEAMTHIKELDSVMNKISIVTDMSTSDLWGQIDAYSAMAQKYGVSIKGAYEVSQIYYQQGLDQKDVMTLTNETLKLSKISGLDYAESTDYMTTAIRGFKLEAEDASRVVDVYSNLASHTAVTQGELAVGMSKTASSLESVGSSFEESSAMIATMVAVTRESATNIGSAMKSIAARYGEMKKDVTAMTDSEGEALSYNKVDTALQSVGISLKDTDGQFRNFTDVIIELGEKWDTLDSVQQRYIATQFAGNRQQSRFLALVSNIDLLKSNLNYAENSEDTGELQALKTMDSIETKQEQLKVAYQQMYTTIGAEDLWKGALGGLTNFMNTLNGLPKLFGKIPIGAIAMVADIVMVLKSLGTHLLSGISKVILNSLPTDVMASKAKEAIDTYQKAVAEESAKKNDKLEQAGKNVQQQITNGTEKAQTDRTQPTSVPEVAKTTEENIVQNTQDQIGAQGEIIVPVRADFNWEEFNANIQDAAVNLQPIQYEAGIDLASAVDNIDSTFLPTLQDAISKIDFSAPDATEQLTSQINSMIQQAGDLGPQLQAAFQDAGMNGITGLVAGLSSNISSATASSEAAGNAVIEALKSAMGVASPSVLAMIAGQNVIQGLSEGLASAAGEAVNSAQAAGKSVIDALKSSMEFDDNSFAAFKDSILAQIDALGPEVSSETKDLMRSMTSNMTLEDFNAGRAPEEVYQWAGLRKQEYIDKGVSYAKEQILAESNAQKAGIVRPVVGADFLTDEQRAGFLAREEGVKKDYKDIVKPLTQRMNAIQPEITTLENKASEAKVQALLELRKNNADYLDFQKIVNSSGEQLLPQHEQERLTALRNEYQQLKDQKAQAGTGINYGGGFGTKGEGARKLEQIDLERRNTIEENKKSSNEAARKEYEIDQSASARISDLDERAEALKTVAGRKAQDTIDNIRSQEAIAAHNAKKAEEEQARAEKRAEREAEIAARKEKKASPEPSAPEVINKQPSNEQPQQVTNANQNVTPIVNQIPSVQNPSIAPFPDYNQFTTPISGIMAQRSFGFGMLGAGVPPTTEIQPSSQEPIIPEKTTQDAEAELQNIEAQIAALERLRAARKAAKEQQGQEGYEDAKAERRDAAANAREVLGVDSKTIHATNTSDEQLDALQASLEEKQVTLRAILDQASAQQVGEEASQEAQDAAKPVAQEVKGDITDAEAKLAELKQQLEELNNYTFNPQTGDFVDANGQTMSKADYTAARDNITSQINQLTPPAQPTTPVETPAQNQAPTIPTDIGISADAGITQMKSDIMDVVDSLVQAGKMGEEAGNSIKEGLSNASPEELKQQLDDLKSKMQEAGESGTSFGEKIKGSLNLGSIGTALSMIANLFDKTSRGGQQAAGAIMALGGAMRVVDGISKAIAGQNPWMALAMGVMAVVNGLSLFFESEEEKMERLKKEAEEASTKSKEAKAEVRDLETSKKKIEELAAKRYDSAEAAEAYQEEVNKLGEKFPALIAGFDEAGNAILDAVDMESMLATARQKAAQATYDAVMAEYEVKKKQTEDAKNAAQGKLIGGATSQIGESLLSEESNDYRQAAVYTAGYEFLKQYTTLDDETIYAILGSDYDTADRTLKNKQAELGEGFWSKGARAHGMDTFDLEAQGGFIGLINNFYKQGAFKGKEDNYKILRAWSSHNLSALDWDYLNSLTIGTSVSGEAQQRLQNIRDAYDHLKDKDWDYTNPADWAYYESMVEDMKSFGDPNNPAFAPIYEWFKPVIEQLEGQDGYLAKLNEYNGLRQEMVAYTRQAVNATLKKNPTEYSYLNSTGASALVTNAIASDLIEAGKDPTDVEVMAADNEKKYSQRMEAWYKGLSEEQIKLFDKMYGSPEKYTSKDILESKELSGTSGFEVVQELVEKRYKDANRETRKRLHDNLETSITRILPTKDDQNKLLDVQAQYTELLSKDGTFLNRYNKYIQNQEHEFSTQEESLLNKGLAMYASLKSSGMDTQAEEYGNAFLNFYEQIQGLDADLQAALIEQFLTNGVTTREGIQKTIDYIKGHREFDGKLNLSEFEQIVNDIPVNIQLLTDSYLQEIKDQWKDKSSNFKKLKKGLDISEMDSIIEDAKSLGVEINESDFIVDKDKFILNTDKYNEYMEAYFSNYREKVKGLDDELSTAYKGLKDTEFTKDTVLDKEQIKWLRTVLGGEFDTYIFQDAETKQFKVKENKLSELQEGLKKGYDDGNKALQEYSSWIDNAELQVSKESQWEVGDYSSLKSIYKNFKGFWKNNDKILVKQVNKRLAQLVSGAERMTEEEQAQPEIKNAMDQIRSAYGTFINDLVTKDIDALYASDYLQTGLGKNIIETQMAQAQNATARSFALWVAGLADAAGQTIAEQNDVFIKAWNKKNDKTTTKGLEGLEFIGTDMFSADTEQLKTFADTYDIKLSDLVDNGIAVYNEAIDTWLVDVKSLSKVGFDSSKITNFQETVADSVNAFFDQLTQLIQNGLSGSLSNADATLLQQYAAMMGIKEGLDFTRTAEGLQLSEQSAIRLYTTLKKIDSLKASLVFDKLKESLEKSNDNFKSVSTLTGHIAKIENEIYAKDGRVSTARLKQYEAELEVAKEILEVRSTSEDSSFNFMSNKIPAAQNNPLNYAANWTQALGKIRDAWNLSKVKKSGKAGFMDYTDFYNIVTEMNNIAALGGPIEVGAYTLDGKLESAAALIQAGADALTAIDTGEVMVDLSGIGLALSSGGSSLEAGITKGIQSMAESQVKMLDGLIAMLEIVVAMEQLGDIAGENNVIDLRELFTITGGEEVTEETLAQVDAFDEGFKIAAKKIKDYLDKDENKEVKKIFENSSVNFGNGIKHSMYEMLDIGDDDAFKKLFPTELEGDAKKAALKTYRGVMNSLYQAVLSGDYDLDNIAASAQKEFAAAGLLDHPITIKLDDTTFVFSSSGATKIEWDSQIVQDLKKKYSATEEEITQVVERYVSGETLTSQQEFEYILVLHGQAEIKNGELIVKCGGNSYSGDEITGQILGKAALEDAGIKLDEEGYIDTNDNEVVGTITYKGTTEQETKITVRADATGIHYQGMDNKWYATEDQAMEANFAMQEEFSDLDEYKWQVYGKRATIKSTVTVDDVEVDLSIPSDIRSQVLDEVQRLNENQIVRNSTGSYDITLESGVKINLDYAEVEDSNGRVDVKKAMNAIRKKTGIDEALQENITAGIKDAIPAIIEGLEGVDASNLQEAAEALGEMAKNLSTLQGISYETIANGLAQLGIHLNNSSLNIPEGGTTPNGAELTGTFDGIENIISALQNVDASNITTAADAINNIKSTKAELASKSLNTIDSTQALRAKNALNSLSITGKTVRAVANIVVQVTHGSSGGSSAKGNIALASGTPTLMGELGPELVVSNGRYFVVGQAGAEFVNLQKDAIVFNHKQTQNLLNNGSIGSRGKPFTNEMNAISYAKGSLAGGPAHSRVGRLDDTPEEPKWNKDWTYTYHIGTSDGGVSGHLWGAPVADIRLPSAAKGSRNGGPAQASASAALAALKQLRAQWQALAKLSAKDLAGKGGGGGGGGGAANFIKDLERWYNLLQEIAKLEKEITYQETLRNKIASDLAPNGEAYVKSQALTLKYLQREVEAAQQLSLEQEDYFKVRQEQLNRQSAFSELYTFDDEGQIKYKSGKFAQLSEIFGGDDTTGKPNHSVKEQYEYLISQGYGYAMEYNESGEKIKIDNKNDETNMKAAIEAFWAKIESDKTEMQELHDSVEEQKDAVLQKMQAQNELLKEIEENQISVEGKVLKAIEDAAQREIDEIKDQKDALQDSNDALIDGLTDALEKERNLYDTSQSESELAQKRRQLAILERSGGSASEIKNLRAEIDSSSKDLYFEKQQEQIDAIQDASDIQIKKMEEQIELMEESLEYQKEHGLLWNQVYTVMQGSPEDIATFIQQNDSEYWGKSPTDLTKTIRDDLFEAEKYVAYRDTVTDEIKVIADLLTTQNLDTEWKQFGDMMANSAEYKDAWGKLSDEQKNNLKAIYSEEFKSSADPNAAARKVWESQLALDYGITKKKEVYDNSSNYSSGNNQNNSGNQTTGRYGIKKSGDTWKAVPMPGGAYTSYADAEAAASLATQNNPKVKLIKANNEGKDQGHSLVSATGDKKDLNTAIADERRAIAEKKKTEKEAAAQAKKNGRASGGYVGHGIYELGELGTETVLTASQTKILRDNILSNRPNSLINLLKSYNEAYHGLSASTYDSITSNTDNGTVIEHAEVNVHVDKLANGYDAEKAGNDIMRQMLNIARKTKAQNRVGG